MFVHYFVICAISLKLCQYHSFIQGKIDMTLELLTKEEAALSPAGAGRDAPQPLSSPL